MKKKEINPLFKIYNCLTYDSVYCIKPQKVSVYQAAGTNKIEKGRKVFEFNYEPIFEYNDYKKLLVEYKNSQLFKELYSLMCFNYFTFYNRSYNWFVENTFNKRAFILEKEIEKYVAKKTSDYSCPIIKYLDLSSLDNINFYRHFIDIINDAEIHGLESVNEVLYGKKEIEFSNKPSYTYLGKLLVNSVINIAYNNFYSFLIEEKNKQQPPILTQDKTIKEQKIKNKEFKPKLFKDLFKKEEIIDKCLNLLKETVKPCIDDENKFLRNKGAFVVWFYALEYKQIFNTHFCNDVQRAKTLEYNFNGLTISNSLFRADNIRATNLYKDFFEKEISAIKH